MRPALSMCSHRLALLGLLLAQPAWAADAIDPTRPPASPTPQPAPTAAATSEERTGAAADASSSVLVLQSLQLLRSGDATAIINGRLYRVGDRIGAETITRIDAQGVVLKGPTATRGLTPYGVLALNIEPASPARTALAKPAATPTAVAEGSTQVHAAMPMAPASAARARGVALVSRGGLSLRLDLGDDSPATPLRRAMPVRRPATVSARPLPWAMPTERSRPSRLVALSAALAAVNDGTQLGVACARLSFSPPMGGSLPEVNP